MTVYKPRNSKYYYFDFQRGGRRFCGSTKRADRAQAEAIERAHIERAEREAEAARIAATAPEMINILPRYVVHVPFKNGAKYFFAVPARLTKAGCPIKSQDLGPDYEAAVARAESMLLPSLDRWCAAHLSEDEATHSDASDPPSIGVYLLMLKGKIVYVGTSRRMPKRVATHRQNGRPFDEVFYIASDETQRLKLEAALIKAINPPQNRAMTIRSDSDAESAAVPGRTSRARTFSSARTESGVVSRGVQP
jgi:hypothetical protein